LSPDFSPPPHEFASELHHHSEPMARIRDLPPRFETPWGIDQHVPALVYPIIIHAGLKPPQISWLILRLNSTVLEQHIVPELVARHFAGSTGLNYEVAFRVPGDTPNVLYSTDRGFGAETGKAADAVMPLWFTGPPF